MKPSFWKKFITLFIAFLSTAFIFAQENNNQPSNFMYSSGRIYVVIAVMLTILTGLIIYLIRLDKKISRLEKDK